MADRRALAAIFAGGFVGAIARAQLGVALPYEPGQWPSATLIVNIAGAFLLGYVATRVQQGRPLFALSGPLLGTGFCGALTTFSTMQLELLRHARRRAGRACRRLRARERRRGVRGGGPRDVVRTAGPASPRERAAAADVGLLGGAGAVARFLVDRAVSARVGSGLGFGTLAVNLSGALRARDRRRRRVRTAMPCGSSRSGCWARTRRSARGCSRASGWGKRPARAGAAERRRKPRARPARRLARPARWRGAVAVAGH